MALQANVVETYPRGTIDTNIETLRADTASNLLLNYNKVEVFNTYEINELLFTQTLTTISDELATKANVDGVYNKSQIDNFFILNDPSLVQAPLQKVFVTDRNREAGTKRSRVISLW